jgi:UDP-MurNAc hydroxylase
MKFQVLSHAGLLVSAQNKTLVCDPWIIGSTYWRSWWNYPPVSPELIASVKPDFIYLTHVHWDHFHGPSLKKFDRNTPVIVPKGHLSRLKRDLKTVGFKNVIELRHGEGYDIAPNFRIYSYQFFPMPDSALVVEADGVTLFNANDSKFMGKPLAQIVHRHPRFDFVFRSHSSANSRLCYEVIDSPEEMLDDTASYIRSFAAFAMKSRARYAVPFASNHCYLHRETIGLNRTIQTPFAIKEYFQTQGITSPEVVVMVSGDSWSSEGGFNLDPNASRFFQERERYLAEYAERQRPTLEAFYEREARSSVSLKEMERYFSGFFDALPYGVRRIYRGHPIRYHLTAGDQTFLYEVDLANKKVTAVEPGTELKPMPEIHMSALIMKHAMAAKFCAQIGIGKRVRFRVTTRTKKYVNLLVFLMNLYESELLPVSAWFRYRFLETWLLRWREVGLYLGIMLDRVRSQRLSEEQYILNTRI